MNNHFKSELEQLPHELRLLLFFLKTEIDDDTISINKGLFKSINWGIFLELAKHHRVYPIIYKKVKKINEPSIPPFVLQSLHQEYQKNIFRMLSLSGEMETISKIFADKKIHTLFLKGPVLATDLYGDLSLRTSADLDILIPIKNLNQAEEILLNDGYIKDDYILTVLNDWKWRHHHITFYHPLRKIKVEIHWRLNPGPAREPRFSELWDRKRVSSLTSYPVYILGLEDLFLFLITHGARHGWSRLRWLVDIDQMVKKKIDWEKIIRLLRKNHYLHLGGQSLFLASNLLNTKMPMEMTKISHGNRTKRLAIDALFYIKQMVNLHSYPIPDEVSIYHKRHLISLMSNQQKTIFVLSYLFPYPKDTEFFPLPKILHFLYFPLRPLLVIGRKIRRRAITRRA
ncbi:nucleotidyltransferase family protein [Neobacillus sp. PS3-40]|uniref:nucleotidyltransferase domain-containing protein n=1 Tax=Neobacillus sp. PS3-40 TaxID=3070679 RepID=UPI0027DF0DEB|nr:nucleotidyltransferase family protein [Neobacillus sp. PS3-40]WML45834.1 nucleotidyltransferase family protein [Neobacillus sp. PS3-40]